MLPCRDRRRQSWARSDASLAPYHVSTTTSRLLDGEFWMAMRGRLDVRGAIGTLYRNEAGWGPPERRREEPP
jgi:hypothetical protein